MPPPRTIDEILSQGRLVAGAGDSSTAFSNMTNAALPDDSVKGRLLRGVQTATSGEKFLGAVSGGKLDISGLPGYIKQPLDILASPVSLGLLAAAPFTGGASLTGVGLAGRLAGLSTEFVAGGIVGGGIAQEVSKRLPEDAPGWLKVGAPLVAGAVTGGIAQGAVARRLPGALKAAERTARPVSTFSDNYGLGDGSPLNFVTSTDGFTQTNQIVNFFKGLTRRGTVASEQVEPRVTIAKKNSVVVNNIQQVLHQEALADFADNPTLKFIDNTKRGGGSMPTGLYRDRATITVSKAAAPVDAAGEADDAMRASLLAYVANPTEVGLTSILSAIKSSPSLADDTLTNIRNQMKGAVEAKKLVTSGALGEKFDAALAATAGEAPTAPTVSAEVIDLIETKLLPFAKTLPKVEAGYTSPYANWTGPGSTAVSTAQAERAFILDYLAKHPEKGVVPARTPYLSSRDEAFAALMNADEGAGTARLRQTRSALNKTSGDLESAQEAVANGERLGYRPEDIAAFLRRNYAIEPPDVPPLAAWQTDGVPAGWKRGGLSDIAEHPELREAHPDTAAFINKWSDKLDQYWTMRGAVRGEQLAQVRGIGPGGKFLTRGRPIEDGTEDIIAVPTGRPKNLKAVPGVAKERGYSSQEEGFLNGESYPPIEEAIATYVAGVGHEANNRHLLNELSKLADPEGNPLIMNLSKAIPKTDEAGAVMHDATGKAIYENYYSVKPPRGYEYLNSIPGTAAEKSLARKLNARLDPQDPLTQANNLAGLFNKPFRALHVAFDLGDFIARVGPTAALMHPVAFGRATGGGLAGIFNPTIVGRRYKQINAELLGAGIPTTIEGMAKNGAAFQMTDFAPGALGKMPVLKHLASFYGNALDMFRAEAIALELMNKSKAGINVLDPAIFRQITAGVNLSSGAAKGAPVDNASVLVQFPNWLQSQIEFLISGAKGVAGQGGLEGQYTRQALIRLLGLGTGIAVVGNAMQGRLGETISEDTDYVPTLRLGNQKINVFGPYASLYRGLKSAIEGDPSYLIRGRASPLLQLGWDLYTGETFIGQKAAIDDPAYWAKLAMPYSLSSITQRPGLVGVESALGLNANEATPLQQLHKQSEEIFGKDFADLTGKERLQLRTGNPDLYQQLTERTKQRAEAGDKYSIGQLETQKVNDRLVSEQQNLVSLLQQGSLSPKQFRESLGSLSETAAIEKQRVRKDFGLDERQKTPSAVQKALNDYYELFNSSDYGVLNGGPKVGQINWDEFSRQETALLSSFSPDQRKAITDRVTVHDPSVQWFYDNKNVINESGYFSTADTAFEKFLPSVHRLAPDAQSLTDLYEFQNRAVRSGNRGEYAYASTLINQINELSETYKKVMRLKDTSLAQALTQNGYISQPKAGAMVAQP